MQNLVTIPNRYNNVTEYFKLTFCESLIQALKILITWYNMLEDQKDARLTHFRPMFHLWINQCVGFY